MSTLRRKLSQYYEYELDIWHYLKNEKEKTEEKFLLPIINSDLTIIDVISDNYKGALQNDLIQMFSCIICVGIAVNPVKCVTCGNIVCNYCL